MAAPKTLEEWAAQAADGDAKALSKVVEGIQDDIYRLALRMLYSPAEAEDATQEILMRVITRLGSFEGRSRFKTWVYRLSVRSLLNQLRKSKSLPNLSFDEFGEDLAQGLAEAPALGLHQDEHRVLTQELRLACTQAMLLCLDGPHRMAYLLGEILQFSTQEAAEYLDISAVNYRKRLSRAREKVNTFTKKHCGLVDGQAPCRCSRRLPVAVQQQRIDPQRLLFARHPVKGVPEQQVEAVVKTIGRFCDGGALMRAHPRYAAPPELLNRIQAATRAARSKTC